MFPVACTWFNTTFKVCEWQDKFWRTRKLLKRFQKVHSFLEHEIALGPVENLQTTEFLYIFNSCLPLLQTNRCPRVRDSSRWKWYQNNLIDMIRQETVTTDITKLISAFCGLSLVILGPVEKLNTTESHSIFNSSIFLLQTNRCSGIRDNTRWKWYQNNLTSGMIRQQTVSTDQVDLDVLWPVLGRI